ncbi:hypothetical protein [Aeromonas salmonicida]|jgi:hypothetical protein|uniref:hypothetical protein n=1 Tax=Aeromonas salmonicida TaxID=645 RepID=UPI003D2632C3
MNAKPQQTTYFGVPANQHWTHVHLMSGRKGREVSREDGEVVIEDEKLQCQSYDEDLLHLTWAPLNRDSQGEKA